MTNYFHCADFPKIILRPKHKPELQNLSLQEKINLLQKDLDYLREYVDWYNRDENCSFFSLEDEKHCDSVEYVQSIQESAAN